MKCLICRQAETIDGFTDVVMERPDVQVVANHVPARVCPGCGESYVDESVAARLLLKADELVMTGDSYSIWEYE